MKREQHAMNLQAMQEKHAADIQMKREAFDNDAKLSRNKMILDYKVAKSKGTDASPVDIEGDMQDAELADPMAEAIKPLADAVAQMTQAMAQQSAEASQRTEAMMTALAQIAALVAAPKKVVRGRNGQVEGVAPDMSGMLQ